MAETTPTDALAAAAKELQEAAWAYLPDAYASYDQEPRRRIRNAVRAMVEAVEAATALARPTPYLPHKPEIDPKVIIRRYTANRALSIIAESCRGLDRNGLLEDLRKSIARPVVESKAVRDLVRTCNDLQGLWLSADSDADLAGSDMHEAIDAVCLAVTQLVPADLAATTNLPAKRDRPSQWTPEVIIEELNDASECDHDLCRWCNYDSDAEQHSPECLVSLVEARFAARPTPMGESEVDISRMTPAQIEAMLDAMGPCEPFDEATVQLIMGKVAALAAAPKCPTPGEAEEALPIEVREALNWMQTRIDIGDIRLLTAEGVASGKRHLATLRAALSRGAGKWSSAKPTEPGVFWWSRNGLVFLIEVLSWEDRLHWKYFGMALDSRCVLSEMVDGMWQPASVPAPPSPLAQEKS